jgi:pyrroline-5-carboxylate reductase
MSRIAFLGAGAMGEALMRGLISAGVYQSAEIVAYDPDAERLETVAEALQIKQAASAENATTGAEVLLVAVKPQMVDAALAPLRDSFSPAQTVISIAAGVPIKQLEANFAQAVPVVRVMPNTPALVGHAATAIALGAHAKEEQRLLAHRIFGAVGIAVDAEEKLLDAVTGLSGSGPAYVYVFIEALSDAGVKMGLPRAVSTRLAAQTVLGAAQMVLQTGAHPGELKDKVTSPGGTTIAALHALENNAFRGAIYDAVEAATLRSRELSNDG